MILTRYWFESVSGQSQNVTIPVRSNGAFSEGVGDYIINKCHLTSNIHITKVLSWYHYRFCLSLQFVIDVFHMNIPVKCSRIQWSLDRIVCFIYHPVIIHPITIRVIHSTINGFRRPLRALPDNNIPMILPIMFNNWWNTVYFVA